MAARPRLSIERARRIALAAQGFADPRPTGRVDRRHIRRVFDRVGLLQVDSVNVLVRSEHLPVFARLGPHDRSLVRSMEAGGQLFEYWAHEASLLPVEIEPLLRWRMASATEGDAWGGLIRLHEERPEFVDEVLAEVIERGPLRAGELAGARPKTEKWWGWNEHKKALELLFWTGRISGRRTASNFERLYAPREHVLPADVLATPTPPPHEARRELLLRAARHHGVGTAKCLADYFRLNVTESRGLLTGLVSEGLLEEVEVEGWTTTAYLHPEARAPRAVRARALLSPFDSLIWDRARTEQLWDFHYRLEIYTPAHKRRHGYYVLPFLLDEELVGRVDLKADRGAGVLRVQAAHVEEGHDRVRVAREMAAELALMAGWLELGSVEVTGRGDLAADLRRVV